MHIMTKFLRQLALKERKTFCTDQTVYQNNSQCKNFFVSPAELEAQLSMKFGNKLHAKANMR